MGGVTKFTDAPWSIRKTPRPMLPGANWREIVATVEGEPRVLGEIFEDDVSAEEAEANAALVAGATELYAAAHAYMAAVKALGETSENKLTYFEASPTNDSECLARWQALDATGKALYTALAKSGAPG